MNNKKKSVIALFLIFAIAASTISYVASQTQTSTTPTPPMLDGKFIGQTLGTPVVIANNQTGVVTTVLVRQTPLIKEPGNITDNTFTLMNNIIEFKLVPGATNNQSVYVMGDFGLLETEVNPVIQQMVAYNWTILNLHPHMKEETPKLQFLHWQVRGNLTTILSNLKTVLALTSIGTTPNITPQTALNANYIASKLGAVAVNGPVADALIARQDVNITSSLNPDIVLNPFVLMGSGFEFMAMPTSGTQMPVNATSGNVFMMGDFALKESEVDAVEKVFLLSNCLDLPLVTNVSVTGQHSHMIQETPKIMFVHVEAMGDLNQIIKLINRALDQTSMRTAQNFTASLSGQTWTSKVNPTVNYTINTPATGSAIFTFDNNSQIMNFTLQVNNIQNVTMAHIHIDTGVVVGPIVIWLYPRNQSQQLLPGNFSGVLATGTVTQYDLTGPMAGMSLSDLRNVIMTGNTYVVVHTSQNPPGEIRGFITTK
jgi:hypothetical protein